MRIANSCTPQPDPEISPTPTSEANSPPEPRSSRRTPHKPGNTESTPLPSLTRALRDPVQRDGGGNIDVERVDAGRHGNADAHVCATQRRGTEPGAFGSDDQRDTRSRTQVGG